MRLIFGCAAKGPGLGEEKAVMGHAWWEWIPCVWFINSDMAGGKMRGIQSRWLCFFCDIVHFAVSSSKSGEDGK